MARNPGPKGKVDTDPQARQDQRTAALRANLAKRKQQVSARRGGKALGKQEPSAFDPEAMAANTSGEA